MKKHLSPQKWFRNFIVLFLALSLLITLLMVIIDPYFHYHGPLNGIRYFLSEERYINNGIARNFDYDGILTGTSMTQNFLVSEAEELYGGTFVKMPFAGAGYKEISENLRAGLESHEVKTVIWGVDYNGFIRDKDFQGYSEYPTYLYDKNPFNDVSYIFNKSIWLHGALKNLLMTVKGEESTSFDAYSSWIMEEPLKVSDFLVYRTSTEYSQSRIEPHLKDAEAEMVRASVEQNILALAKDYPDTEFVLFYPPFSILYFDLTYQWGDLTAQLEAEEIVTRMLVEQENIKLYSYFTETELISDLKHYKDKEHYDASYNVLILNMLSEGKGRITKDNVDEYLAFMKDTYLNYDYDAIYE